MTPKAQTIISPERTLFAKDVLERVVMPSGDVRLALVSTPDGFEVASLGASGALEVRRLAAMAGSMMAMARAVGREINYVGCKRLTFETDSGVAIFQAIAGGFPCILCLVLETQAVLGRALWVTNEAAQQLGQGD